MKTKTTNTLFIERWINALDKKLFTPTEKCKTVYKPFKWEAICAFVGFLILAAISIFSKHSESAAAFICGAVIFIVFWTIQGVYLWKTLRFFQGGWVKTGRIFFVFLMCAIGEAIGTLAAACVVFVCFLIVAYYVIKFVLAMTFESVGSKTVYRTSDGTKITETKGLCGESYYEGNDGRNYERNGDTFTEK